MSAHSGSTRLSHVTDDEPITNVVAANFSGRFKGNEVKDLGQAVIRHVVAAKNVGLLIGQQVNWRMTSLPENFDLVGGQRAFVLYCRDKFRVSDEAKYRHHLRELELKGRLPKYYLPESNYALCKIKSKRFVRTTPQRNTYM